MTAKADTPQVELKLKEFCERIGASHRDARYALAYGMMPRGIDEQPGRGNHRVFDYDQAFGLAIVLRCKAAGIKPRLAVEMVDGARRCSVNLGWDWQFSPFDGHFETDNQWFLEVGDAEFAQILTDASPSREGVRDASDWVNMKTRKRQPDAAPIVVLRIDLSQLAHLLSDM